MKTLRTEINIQSSPEKIWEILTDFPSYPDWNPFIREISGDLSVGNKISVTMEIKGRKPDTFKPVLLSVVPNEKLCWRGKNFIKGIFDGTHHFGIEPFENGTVRFIHGESFKGILSGWILRKIGEKTLAGFEKMNLALKNRAEEK